MCEYFIKYIKLSNILKSLHIHVYTYIEVIHSYMYIYIYMYILYVCICISYNTGKSALPDIYARYPRACSARGRVRIYQAKHECLCYKSMLHFQHSKHLECPNLKLTAQLAYIVTDADCDCGRYFYVFITLPNVSMMYPIILILIMGLYSH